MTRFFTRVLLLIIYLFVGMIIISAKQRIIFEENYYKLVTEDSNKGNYGTLIKFSDYYVEDPLYKYESDNIDYYLHETVIKDNNNADSVFYSVFILGLNEASYSFVDDLSDLSSMTVYCGNDDTTGNDIPLHLTGYSTYNIVSSGIYKSELNSECIDLKEITRISVTDYRGLTIMEETVSFKLENDVDSIKAIGISGFSDKEKNKIYSPSGTRLILLAWFSVYTLAIFLIYKLYFDILLAKIFFKNDEVWQNKHKKRRKINMKNESSEDITLMADLPEDPYL